MKDATDRQKAARPYVKGWLWSVALLVFAMVLLGGATRLTDSGLSITEWQPVMGTMPPMSDADWQEAFAKYQLTAEYQIQNKGMSLEAFKVIFWWEWAHRFLGRLIGVVFLAPLLVFLALRRIETRLLPPLAGIFVLGALQGLLGWYMVKSGLTERVDVSQYRLAAHLTLAAAILAALVWTVLGVATRRGRPRTGQEWLGLVILLLLLVQIGVGGFVAGLDAGMGYNTWPKMDGEWIPSGLLIMEPWWRNLFENAMTVQFMHRVIAYVLIVLIAWQAWSCFTIAAWVSFYIAVVQVGLGIWTLLWHVKLTLALLHQGTAMVLLVLTVWSLSVLLAIRPAKVSEAASGRFVIQSKA